MSTTDPRGRPLAEIVVELAWLLEDSIDDDGEPRGVATTLEWVAGVFVHLVAGERHRVAEIVARIAADVEPGPRRDAVAMWKDRISRWVDTARFNSPGSTAALQECERALGQQFPPGLAELLLECDGVEGEYDVGLVWPIERIKNDNLAFRANRDFASLYMPFDPLLFFADAGNGDQFAFVMRDRPADVFVWDHETDSRTWIAPSLDTYLEWWLGGRITL